MKNFFSLIILLSIGTFVGNAQYQQLKDLPDFENIEMDGNIRLYLQEAAQPSIAVKTKKAWQAAEYTIEVRNNTLYVKLDDHHEKSSPKITLYLKHTGVKDIHMEGFLKITTVDPLRGERLTLTGDGFIKGEVAVEVEKLSVDLDGFCTLELSGKATTADLSVDGFGKIKARELETQLTHQSAEGLANIRVGN